MRIVRPFVRMFDQAAAMRDDGRGQKLLVILGATGSGKTRLSVDIAKEIGVEIINSDKMQLYKGLDVTTNKAPVECRGGVRHHLLGDFDACEGEVTGARYRVEASAAVVDVSSRGRLPILVGGSNSFVHALLARRFVPGLNVFDGSTRVSTRLRYDCRFIWVGPNQAVSNKRLDQRVDDMVGDGMVDELEGFFAGEGTSSGGHSALRKAIGVPEFAEHFGGRGGRESYRAAVNRVKENTRVLAERQTRKISHMVEFGWDIRRVDPTPVYEELMEGECKKMVAECIWKKQVVEPSLKMVTRFLVE